MLIIGDVPYNKESHLFVESIDDLERLKYGGFDSRIPLIDVEWLGLKRDQCKEIVETLTKPYVMVSVNPEMFYRKWTKDIQYRSNYNEKDDLFKLFNYINASPYRMKVYERLKSGNESLHLLLKWYMSSVTPNNFQLFQTLDKYINVIDPNIWLSILAFGIEPNDVGRMEYRFGKGLK